MAVKQIDIAFATPIPMFIETTFTTFKYSSFSRGTMFTKTCGFPSLVMTCYLDNEDNIENDKNAVAIVWDDCTSKKAVGHIPLKWSKVAFKFLQFTNNHLCVKVTGKGVNRGVGLGLEILVNYFVMEMQVF